MTEPTDAEIDELLESYPDGMTLEMIGAVLGVTKARAQQLVESALSKILRHLRAQGIRHINDVVDPRHYDHRSSCW